MTFHAHNQALHTTRRRRRRFKRENYLPHYTLMDCDTPSTPEMEMWVRVKEMACPPTLKWHPFDSGTDTFHNHWRSNTTGYQLYIPQFQLSPNSLLISLALVTRGFCVYVNKWEYHRFHLQGQTTDLWGLCKQQIDRCHPKCSPQFIHIFFALAWLIFKGNYRFSLLLLQYLFLQDRGS